MKRTSQGNMLVLTTAVTLGLVLVMALVALLYVRFTAGHQEQKTAIEAAALAAAKDLSMVVIEDPYFGFVSLSDYAPVGTATAAGDGFSMPVQSINTILATVRLDMIIADQLQAPIMQQCAARDYQSAMSTVNALNDELTKDIQPGGSGKDINGNKIEPYSDAMNAYEENIIRIMGPSNRLLPGTFKITLGCIDSIPTDMPIPQPSGASFVKADQQLNNCYVAYRDAPYGNQDFIFAGATGETALVDLKKFQDKIPGLKYSIPTIVKCEGDQTYRYTDAHGRQATGVVHAAACAEPACLVDPRPHPGALTYSFPNGMVAGVSSPATIFSSNSPCDLLQTPPQGDYPDTPLVDTQINGSHPPLSNIMQMAIYDWVRLAGPHANVQAVADALFKPFSNALPATSGQIHLYEVNAQGSVNYSVLPSPAALSTRVSNDQWTAVSGEAAGYQNPLSTANTSYDALIRDDVYQPGRIRGGKHGGQPLADQLPQASPAATSVITAVFNGQPAYARQIDPPLTSFPTPTGTGVRPTYNAVGQAVDIKFRLHGAS